MSNIFLHIRRLFRYGTAHIDDIHLLAGDITASFSEVHGDGIIDIDDFIRILRTFAHDADERIKIYTDINEDGLVNVSDIAVLKKNFGK